MHKILISAFGGLPCSFVVLSSGPSAWPSFEANYCGQPATGKDSEYAVCVAGSPGKFFDPAPLLEGTAAKD